MKEEVLEFLGYIVFAIWHFILGAATSAIQYAVYLFLAKFYPSMISLLISLIISISLQTIYVIYQIYEEDSPESKVKDILVYYAGYSYASMYIPIYLK